MTTSSATRFVLRDDRDLDRLLERLTSGRSETLTVEVPKGSSALLAASEFRRILAALNESAVSLSLQLDPDDRRRRSMAWMLGLPLAEDSEAGETLRDTDARELREASGPPVLSSGDQPTADLGTYTPSLSGRLRSGATRHRSVTGTIVVATKEIERSAATGSASLDHRQGRVAERFTSAIADGRARRPSRGPEVTRLQTRVARVLLVACLLLIAAATAGTLIVVLVPRATITLVPETRTLELEFTYGLATGERRLDLALAPRAIERRIAVDLSAPVTGERFEPDGTASGTVDLINPFPQAVTVPAGTSLIGRNGSRYLTVEDVTVPAADPFGSLSFGSTRVAIQAEVAGPDGNADPGVVTGQLDNGVFYRNQEAVTGGTLKRIPLVTEADIEGLRERARAELQARVEQALNETLAPGELLVDGSTEIGEPSFEFSHRAGDATDQLTVHAALTVRARAYNPEAMHQQAQDEAGRRLARLAGPNDVVLGNTLDFSQPEAIDSAGLAWRIRARGQARAVLTEAQLAAVRQAVLGRPLDEAEAALRQIDGIAEARITLEPDWAPRRMPEFASQIEVVVESE